MHWYHQNCASNSVATVALDVLVRYISATLYMLLHRTGTSMLRFVCCEGTFSSFYSLACGKYWQSWCRTLGQLLYSRPRKQESHKLSGFAAEPWWPVLLPNSHCVRCCGWTEPHPTSVQQLQCACSQWGWQWGQDSVRIMVGGTSSGFSYSNHLT